MGRRWDRLWVYFTIIRALNGALWVVVKRMVMRRCGFLLAHG